MISALGPDGEDVWVARNICVWRYEAIFATWTHSMADVDEASTSGL